MLYTHLYVIQLVDTTKNHTLNEGPSYPYLLIVCNSIVVTLKTLSRTNDKTTLEVKVVMATYRT